MKRVTLQDIADSLGVSRISVWKVFSGREGVSDDLRRRIIAKASELNYNFPKDFDMPDDLTSFQRPLNISVTVCRPETSLLWMNIIHEIAREFSKENVNLIYTYLPNQITDDYKLPSQLTNGSLDGIIVMNVFNRQLLTMLSQLSLPKVYLDCIQGMHFDELNGDLVLASGHSCVKKITDYILDQGKTKIGFIGDINFSRTNHERYEGFLDALFHHKIEFDPKMCYIEPLPLNTCEKQIEQFIKGLEEMPEAFICCNDYIACILWRQLNVMGYRIPQDILVSGFDGIQGHSLAKELTSVRVFSQSISTRLAAQIIYKIKNPSLRHELIYTSSEVVFQSSTDGSLQ